jgi:NSS family neurotransmitter:Na+ symporter
MVENHGVNRIYAAVWAGITTWLLGIGTVLSFNLLAGEEYQLFGLSFFDLLDYLTANIMLPLGGLFIALFAAWQMRRESNVEELGMGDGVGFRVWYFLVRYITPLAVIVVFLNAIGVLTF